MVAINWLAILFLFFSIFEFFVVAPPKVGKTDGSSTKKGLTELFKNVTKKTSHAHDNSKKRILLLADAFLTHYNFALNLANVLASRDFEVYFVVVKYENKELKKPLKNVNMIEILFNDDGYIQTNEFVNFLPGADWTEKKQFNFEGFKKLIGFYMFSFYKAIIENPQVEIEGKNIGIFDWLKAKVKENFFDLGITEVCVMTGALYLFKEIGLEKYVTTTAASPFPVHLHFLGESFNSEIPERFTAQVGYGLEGTRKERKPENKKNYKEIMNKFINFYKENHKLYLKKARAIALKNNKNLKLIKSMPTLGELLRKSKYYFVNQHDLGQFPIQNRSEKIINIGGIEIEMEKQLQEEMTASTSTNIVGEIEESSTSSNNSYAISYNDINFSYRDLDCLVVFSMGTAVNFNGFTEAHFDVLINTFSNRNDCNFIVRIKLESKLKNKLVKNKKLVKGNNGGYFNMEGGDIFFYDGMIKQKELLENKNIKLFVTHGGQNSFNEALYAGVPLIVIPFFGDQPSNATLAEYLKIGVAVDYQNFSEKFLEAFNEIMNEEENIYRKNAKIIKNSIKEASKRDKGQINKFIHYINKAIKDKKGLLDSLKNLIKNKKFKFEETELPTIKNSVEKFLKEIGVSQEGINSIIEGYEVDI